MDINTERALEKHVSQWSVTFGTNLLLGLDLEHLALFGHVFIDKRIHPRSLDLYGCFFSFLKIYKYKHNN